MRNATSPSSVWRKRTSRGGSPGRPATIPDALRVSLDVRARERTPGGRLAQRLEVRLHGDDLGHGIGDRALDLRRDLVSRLERQVAAAA